MLTLNIFRYTVQSSPASGLVGIVFKLSLHAFIFNLFKENLKASKPSNNVKVNININIKKYININVNININININIIISILVSILISI